ncbi:MULTISPECIES: HD domain-containing phosphohydrolase [unclassified Devosia]|uniref:HD-GYP domain-containing protein n=1 Tax=unclassified Devosia TaxID=196773 RepID=UPI000B18F0BC|nr:MULTISPECIES: HD domain-containing phosphohydrolase [unclassified Devosia]MBN9364060.1 HD domain-containing protein [Devosia sp.]
MDKDAQIEPADRGTVVFVCDPHWEGHGRAIAGKLGAPIHLLSELRLDDLADAEQVVVDADLRDMDSVGRLKHALDRVPAIRARTFLIDEGSGERLLRVQANALGATRHMVRKFALAELRREYSVTGRARRTAAAETALRADAGGASIAEAEHSLETLFEGMLSDAPVSLQAVSQAAAGVLASVRAVGADAWLASVRRHHEGTFQHCLLVTGVAAGFAKGAGLGGGQAAALMNAALLHDVGKAVIPRHILDKPGKLTAEEFEAVKLHPGAGFDYLSKQGNVSALVLDAVRHHHEALDGSGYPDRLRGAEIGPLTRILTVCDIFAALVETRPYKEARTPLEAINVLIDMSIGSKVDYAAVRTLGGSFGVPLPERFGDVVRGFTVTRPHG